MQGPCQRRNGFVEKFEAVCPVQGKHEDLAAHGGTISRAGSRLRHGVTSSSQTIPASVSQHLSRLRLARLVKARREGTFMYYTVVSAEIRLVLDTVLDPPSPARCSPSPLTQAATSARGNFPRLSCSVLTDTFALRSKRTRL